MKMYKQPQTDIIAFNTERMMEDLTVSVNEGGGGNGVAGAPPRHGDIIE